MNAVIKLLTISSILFCYSCSLPSQEITGQFDALLSEQFPADGPGAVALVAKEGKIIYRKAFGMASLEHQIPMKPENVFRIGSITKQFTSCAILKLMEEGKLSLQDDITTFIEDYPVQGEKITIEHLLTHTSGIKSYTGMREWTSEIRKKNFTPSELIDFFKDQPMDFKPGEDYRYNNSAYFILGYIIEIISGKTYEEYITENFFIPLEMNDSYYGSNTRIVKNRANGYQENGNTYENAPYLSMTQPYAAGSLLSTVDDLYKWYRAVMNFEVINQESLKKAHTPFKLNNGNSTGYGFGWSLGNIQNSPTIEHGGGINGFLTSSIYLPEEDLFVAVFSNCVCHSPDNVATKMAALTIGKPYEWEEMNINSAELESYQAVYESEYNGTRTISFEDDKLFSMVSGGTKYRIIPFAIDKFFFEDGFSTLEFERDNDGKIKGLTSRGRGKSIWWEKTGKPIQERHTIELEPAILQQYCGEYELFPEFILTVTMEEGKMMVQATGQEKSQIFPESETIFFSRIVDAQFEFVKDNSGKVTNVILYQGGQEINGKKLE